MPWAPSSSHQQTRITMMMMMSSRCGHMIHRPRWKSVLQEMFFWCNYVRVCVNTHQCMSMMSNINLMFVSCSVLPCVCEMKWHDIMTWDMFLASQWSPQAKISKAMHSAVIGSLHAMILVTLRMEPLPEVVRHDSDGDIDWPLADVLKHSIQLAIDQRVNVIFERFTPRRLLLRRLCWNNLADLSVEILND